MPSSSSSSSGTDPITYGERLVGFTSAYDKASNKTYERLLHAESRSSLYPRMDSVYRLQQAQRGTLTQNANTANMANIPNLGNLGNLGWHAPNAVSGGAALQPTLQTARACARG